MSNLKRTPLYEIYKNTNAKIINFSGWELPVQFEGIIKEHENVRKYAGIFDVSHMGEIEIAGPDALNFLQYMSTNDLSKLNENQILYTLFCYPDGGVVDDLLIYKLENNHYYLIVNASNIQKDMDWIIKNKKDYNIEVNNISEITSEIALQGPNSEKILQNLVDTDLDKLNFFHFIKDVKLAGEKCLISRTGYTGEDGFEIYCKNESAATIWNDLIKTGNNYNLKPAGLGARDTLRFEAGLPLYGNEISKEITPLEAGLNYFVKLEKDNFIGKNNLKKQKEQGLNRKLIGFKMLDRGIPRHGYKIEKNNIEIGFVTTGYYSPTLKSNLGLAIIDVEHSEIGNYINILIRNKKIKAEIISKKFYDKKYKKSN